MPEAEPDLAALRAQVDAADREADPKGWAWASLGYGEALSGAGSEHAAEAIAALRDALSVIGRDVHARAWYLASLTLGYLLFQYQPAAEAALREAHAIAGQLVAAAGLAPDEATAAAAQGLADRLHMVLPPEDQGVRPADDIGYADAMLAQAEQLMRDGGDMQQTIAALHQALARYQPGKQPGPWFRCQWYLGQLLGSTAETCAEILAASEFLKAAVTVKPPDARPGDYAQACDRLAVLLTNPLCPQDPVRSAEALGWAEESLANCPDDHPGFRIAAAKHLGLVFRRTGSTDPVHLSRSAGLLEQAADQARQAGAPASVVAELGHEAAKLHLQILQDRRDHLEAAIALLTGLLDTDDGQLPASLVAAARQDLGTAYLYRIAGDPADNSELAVENLEAALAAWDRTTRPDEWASVANNLANGYGQRIRGDHSENLERAISLAEAASPIRTRAKDPVAWARTVHVLGGLYAQRLLGSRPANMETSISLSTAAIKVETKKDHPAEWAGAQRNLGNAYLKRVLGDRDGNLKRAARCFRGSLAVTAGLDDLRAHGDSLYGLGLALSARGELAGAKRELTAAATAFRQAAAVYADLGLANWRAASQFQLADVLAAQPGDEIAAQALTALLDCLPTWDAEHNPLRAPVLYARLAEICDRLRDTARAYDWIGQALAASERLYGGATAEDSKTEVVAESSRWFIHAVDLALRSGAPASEALVLAERGRARLLREAAIRLEPDWEIPAELLDTEAGLLADRRNAWRDISAAGQVAGRAAGQPGGTAAGPADPGFARVQELTAQLARVWEQMRGHKGGAEYVAARQGVIGWDQLRDWVASQPAGFALLEYVVLVDRVVAFVVRQDRTEPAVAEIPLTEAALGRCARALYREMDGSAAGAIRRETWDRTALPLITQVQPELAGTRLLCVVPHLLLHHFPLHALGAAGSTLLDQMAVYYAPSAAIALQLSRGARAARPPAGESGRVPLVAGDSLGDLRHARAEAEQAGQVLGVRPLIGAQASVGAVRAALANADLAHFACHGYLWIDDPGLSAIVLADGLLTAAQLQDSTLRCDILVLSGCDTGFQPVSHRTLDAGGLPSALLAAGARTTVAGLWPVNDAATRELFGRFYAELTSERASPDAGGIDRSVAGCLRTAALALRESRPERYFWAPFIVVGAW